MKRIAVSSTVFAVFEALASNRAIPGARGSTRKYEELKGRDRKIDSRSANLREGSERGPAFAKAIARGAMRYSLAAATLVSLLVAGHGIADAGSPFLTDDPEPLELGHSELYLFQTNDEAPVGEAVLGPAIEYNYGFAANAQAHVVLPYACYTPPAGSTACGLGDTELGVKFRFVPETRNRPQIGIYPMIELPTGNVANGLGNGRAWYKIPLWMQKSWGPWTAFGGAGFAINDAPGDLDFGFGGLALQREFGPHVTFGGEVYTQGTTAPGGRGATLYNFGGYLKPSERINILLSVGHSFRGDSHAVAYAALYWTWGRNSKH